jgi:chromate transporter
VIDGPTFFWLVLRASLLSSGGIGNLPLLHQDLLARGWAGDRDFATALAIGQVAPGPNGLWVVALGYLVYGLPGAALSAVAVTLPPLLVVPVGRLHQRYADIPAVRGFVRGLTLALAGSVPLVFLRVAYSSYGLDWLGAGIIVLTVALIASRRVPIIAVLGLGAGIGIAGYR